MRIHKNHLTDMPAKNMNQGRQMAKIRRDRTQAKYKALDMTELSLKVAIKVINHRIRAGYVKEHPDLISAFMTTAAANFTMLTERKTAEAEQVTTINVKTGEQTI